MTARFFKLSAIGLLVLLFLSLAPTIALAIEVDELSLQSSISDSCALGAANKEQWQPIQRTDIPQRAHFCLRTKITIHEGELERLSAIAISMLGAARISWDGITITENGVVGADRESEVPGQIDFMYPLPPELTKPGSHLLMLEVSNFHIQEKLGSIFYYLDVVDYSETVHKPWLIVVVMIGALLVITTLFLLLSLFYEWKANYLWVSALSLSFALLLLAEKYRAIFGYSYDVHTMRLHLVLFFTCMSCSCLCGYYLFYYEFKKPLHWLAGCVLLFLIISIVIPGYDGKSAAVFFTAIALSLVINIIAIAQKKRNARPNGILIISVLFAYLYSPWDFLESRFAYTSFGIVAVMMATLFHEMKINRSQALTAVRLESELLKRNLQPHFLMNSLMLVVEWIEQNPKAAVNFVMALAEELRILVKFSGLKSVSLEEELSLCKRHIEIMAFRYKANYHLEVEGDISAISVPPAVLHTQIENTFTHNKLASDAVLKLKVKQSSATVVITYESPLGKKPMSAAKKNKLYEGMGVGDRYIRSRLDELFSNRYSYSSDEKNGFWINTLVLHKVK